MRQKNYVLVILLTNIFTTYAMDNSTQTPTPKDMAPHYESVSQLQTSVNRLLLATIYEDVNILTTVLRETPAEAVNLAEKDGGLTALLYIAFLSSAGQAHQAREKIQLFLADERVDPTIPDNSGLSPFYYACVSPDAEIIKAFLQHPRVNVNETWYENKMTALHVAVTNIHGRMKPIIALLEDTRINPNTQTLDGLTPLHCALQDSRHELVALPLINDPRIKIDMIDSQGNTPLHYAAKNGCTKIFQVLIQHGANLEARNKNGKTPLDLARDFSDPGF